MSQHFYHNERSARVARFISLMVAVSLVFAVFTAAADFFICYEVAVDGEIVGYVDSEATYRKAKSAVEDYVSELLHTQYTLPAETSCTMRIMTGVSVMDAAPVVNAMYATVSEVKEMYLLLVDGNVVAGAADKKTVETVLEAIVEKYTRGDEAIDAKITNDIEIVHRTADARLCLGAVELYDVLTEDDLITVQASYVRTTRGIVPHNTVTLMDETQYLDYEKTIEGTDGKVEYHETYTLVNGVETASAILDTVILEEATDTVIVKGTKEIPATRPTGTYINPLESGKFTSDYGKRGASEFHTGVDVSAPSGTPILASDSGKVIFAGTKGNYGKYIIIEHGDGVQTRYAHLSKISVKAGDEVVQGQVIGRVGSTGRSTGPHIHFEVLKDGKVVDPNDYIDMSAYEDYRSWFK